MLQFKLKLFEFKLNNNCICLVVSDQDLPHVNVLDDLGYVTSIVLQVVMI